MGRCTCPDKVLHVVVAMQQQEHFNISPKSSEGTRDL